MEKQLPPESHVTDLEPRRIPIHAKCGNCFYGQLGPGPDGKLDVTKRHCFEGPPTTFAVSTMVKTPLGMQPATQIMTGFPQVDVTMRCHHWAPQDRDRVDGVPIIGPAEGRAN